MSRTRGSFAAVSTLSVTASIVYSSAPRAEDVGERAGVLTIEAEDRFGDAFRRSARDGAFGVVEELGHHLVIAQRSIGAAAVERFAVPQAAPILGLQNDFAR